MIQFKILYNIKSYDSILDLFQTVNQVEVSLEANRQYYSAILCLSICPSTSKLTTDSTETTRYTCR